MKHLHKLLLALLFGFLVQACSTERSEEEFAYLKSEVYGIEVFTRLEDAQLCAKETQKPILLIFDLLSSSTRKSSNLLAKYIEKNNVDDEYTIVVLFTDDKTPSEKKYDAILPNGESRQITTVGDENMLFQISLFNTLATPYHVIINYNLGTLKDPVGYFSDEKSIEEFLLLDL